MKKTLIALMALAGVASAESTLTPIASVENYSISDSCVVSLSDITSGWSDFSGDINATTGFTLQITLTNWTVANGPLFYFSTGGSDNSSNATSLVTVGYTSGNNISGWTGATLFNKANGSATTGNVTYSNIAGKVLPSHATPSNNKLSGTISLFVTGKNGAITLYEVDSSNQLVEICNTTCLDSGTAQSIVFSQWTNDAGKKNSNRATVSMTAYSGVLSTGQMSTLIPEPTTATLSLLALAGLAARRRRK